jgi:hypothetical protein
MHFPGDDSTIIQTSNEVGALGGTAEPHPSEGNVGGYLVSELLS